MWQPPVPARAARCGTAVRDVPLGAYGALPPRNARETPLPPINGRHSGEPSKSAAIFATFRKLVETLKPPQEVARPILKQNWGISELNTPIMLRLLTSPLLPRLPHPTLFGCMAENARMGSPPTLIRLRKKLTVLSLHSRFIWPFPAHKQLHRRHLRLLPTTPSPMQEVPVLTSQPKLPFTPLPYEIEVLKFPQLRTLVPSPSILTLTTPEIEGDLPTRTPSSSLQNFLRQMDRWPPKVPSLTLQAIPPDPLTARPLMGRPFLVSLQNLSVPPAKQQALLPVSLHDRWQSLRRTPLL